MVLARPPKFTSFNKFRLKLSMYHTYNTIRLDMEELEGSSIRMLDDFKGYSLPVRSCRTGATTEFRGYLCIFPIEDPSDR